MEERQFRNVEKVPPTILFSAPIIISVIPYRPSINLIGRIRYAPSDVQRGAIGAIAVRKTTIGRIPSSRES
jgi:hypothetical protein